LRPGELVEVRPSAEILATLDENGSLDGMPFMPEMLEHIGRRFTVARRVEKICNNVDFGSSPGRRVRSTVHLDDLRCDGSAHGGCQLGCRLYWKEEWLRRVDESDAGGAESPRAVAELEALSSAGTRTVRDLDGEPTPTYRCQATEALVASESLSKYDPRQFVREVTSRNVGLPHLLSVILRAVWWKALRVLRIRRMLPLPIGSNGAGASRSTAVGLRPGDLVRVRSEEEIAATLNPRGRNRGLSFSPEMLPYCGGTYRIRNRVERLIDEKTGEMIEISNDCLILDDVVCRGEDGCWAFMFCPRGTYPFWREAWLQRAAESPKPEILATHEEP
jgi:hypothetical protein